MSLAIYKPGRGYWTRTMSAVGFGVIILMGGYWPASQFANVRIGGYDAIYTRGLVFVLFVGFFAALAYYLIGTKPRFVDFLIATEGEMKKVNWSNRREILGSTWVVIGVTVFLALLCFLFDGFFQFVFQQMNVLETTSPTLGTGG